MTFAEFLKFRKEELPYFGGMLTGSEIIKQVENGGIVITDFDQKHLNPNSYNVHVGNTVTMYHGLELVDLHDPDTFKDTVTYDISPEDGFILRPGNLYLVPTRELFSAGKFIPKLTGRSSIGRLGIRVHNQAGFGDIGYRGVWTMTMTVVYPTKIYPGDEIAQMYFIAPCGNPDLQYHGKYQGETTAIPSRWDNK